MIYVSDAWKSAHEQMILPESFVEITLGAIDDTVTGSVSTSNPASFSRSIPVINNEGFDSFPKYAMLEHNLWVLDGSRPIMESLDYYIPPAYVTEDDGACELGIELYQINSNPVGGFVITWSSEFDEYASAFTVTIKNGGAVVATQSVTDNTSVVSSIEMPVSNYDSVTITVQEWSHPNQRKRIDSLMFGQRIVFTKDEIISYSHEQSGSPLGTELSKNSIEFEVDNSDGRWNMLNPSGMAKYLYDRQKVTVRYGLQTIAGMEWIQAGVFYLSEWRAPANGITATFVARDALEFALNATYDRPYVNGVIVNEARVFMTKDAAVYTNNTTNPFITLLAGHEVRVYEKSVWYGEGYGGDPEDPGLMVYRIDEGWLLADYVQITSDDSLFFDLSKAMDECMPSDVVRWICDEATVGVSAPTAINAANTAEFIQQCVASYGVTIWQNAAAEVGITSPTNRLTDYVITANASYAHPEVELAKQLRRVNMVQHYRFSDLTKTITYEVNSDGEDITVDCDYLWWDDARTDVLANRYIDWWKNREIVSGEFRADPRLELFDVVQVETKYGVVSPVMITYLKYTYNGAFHGTYEGKTIAVEEV